ncbi:MAG TPA: MFS transporter [Nitrospirota bacterium]|nr:MFS transporter [Nitrospirota bacterium]
MQETSLINTIFRSLRHRNFRLFFSGQLVSLIGTWMQNVGQAWLVLEMTHSSFKLGVVSALQFAPMLFLSFFAGTFVDYFSKRKIIIVTQTFLMLLAFTLAILDFTGVVQYWHVVILATLLGIVNTIDMPARQSFIIEMVGKEDLMNAIAMNSSIFNAARAVGPAIAGLLIGAAGTVLCFFVNGLSFLAVLWGLLLMKFESAPASEPRSYHVVEDIKEAMRYIKATPVVMVTILLVAVVSIFATNFTVLVPVFARQELHRDAAAFGFLLSSFGIGALIGAVSLAALSRHGPKPAILLGGGMGLSLMLILIGLQKTYGITALLLALSGWCMVTFFGMANTTVQLNTEDRLRGRVMSVYTFTFGGLTPFGSLFAGTVAHWIKAPLTFALGGLISGIVFLIVILKRQKIAAWRTGW